MAPTVSPTRTPIVVPTLPPFNNSECVLNCFCSGGSLPVDQATCRTCTENSSTNGSLLARTGCCERCCERTIYLRLVFDGSLPDYIANASNSVAGLRNEVELFVTAQSTQAGGQIAVSQIENTDIVAGSIAALIEFKRSVSDAAAQGLVEHLVGALNNQSVVLRLRNGMELVGVGMSTDPDALGDQSGLKPDQITVNSDDDNGDVGMIVGIVFAVLFSMCLVGALIYRHGHSKPDPSVQQHGGHIQNPIYGDGNVAYSTATAMEADYLDQSAYVDKPGNYSNAANSTTTAATSNAVDSAAITNPTNSDNMSGGMDNSVC